MNKACLKDSFLLSRVDQLVKASTGHEILNFIDAISSYNKIRKYDTDQENTIFMLVIKLFYSGNNRIAF